MPGTFRFSRKTSSVALLRSGIVACAASLLVLSSFPASADTCTDLKAQLEELSRAGRGSTAQARRYDDAARQQAAEIVKTRAIQEAQGCFRNPTALCQSLNRTISQMKANMDALERQRDRLSVSPNVARIRAVQARIRANDCDAPKQVVAVSGMRPAITLVPEPDRPADSDTRLTSVIVRDGVGREQIHETPRDSNGPLIFDNPDAMSAPQLSGTFRTLCVRTCDGYYFPISFSTTSDMFGRDAQACNAMCPATETKLYFHRVPDQESEAMVSMAGEPYTALPTAFLYRERRTDSADPSCSCGKPLTPASLPLQSQPDALQQANAVPTPDPRPDGLADPESQMNAATGLTGDRIREMAGAVTTGEEHADDSARKVRVVGPEFLPDPEEAIDLRSPGQTSVR